MTKNTEQSNATERIRIIYRSECPKLTPRGKGVLSYEFGVEDKSGSLFVRIAANSQGGTCSFEWIDLTKIEALLGSREDQNAPFAATLFRKAFVSRSANNHGYLAAILKAEKVISAPAEQPTQLRFVSFEPMKVQLTHLKTEDIDLPDLVAADLRARVEKRQAQVKEQPATVGEVKKKGRPRKVQP